MPNPVIERAARAIANLLAASGHRVSVNTVQGKDDLSFLYLEKEGGLVCVDANAITRTVLRAIREPGNDIYQAGFDAEASANPHKTQPHHVVPAVWQAMIDAALGEK